jgi:acyl phosphate:glycerol-3-phosphate acyltransferase
MPVWPLSLTCLACFLGAYFLGATPFGFLAAKAKGIDIRQHGSGNIGATNVIRVLGKGIGIPVFILDALKGWFPVWLAGSWAHQNPHFEGNPQWASVVIVLAALGSILGHNFTFWLGFKGGKGVATSAGAMIGVAWIALLSALIVWLVSMKACRYVSLSSMIAALVLPVVTLILGLRAGAPDWPVLVLTSLILVLTLIRHRSNISRLRAGTEPKAGATQAGAQKSTTV